MVNTNLKGSEFMYFVECCNHVIVDDKIGKLFFRNERRAKQFCINWTSKGYRFCRIFEYLEPNYFNDYQKGYQWIYSYRNGKMIRSWYNVKDL